MNFKKSVLWYSKFLKKTCITLYISYQQTRNEQQQIILLLFWEKKTTTAEKNIEHSNENKWIYRQMIGFVSWKLW